MTDLLVNVTAFLVVVLIFALLLVRGEMLRKIDGKSLSVRIGALQLRPDETLVLSVPDDSYANRYYVDALSRDASRIAPAGARIVLLPQSVVMTKLQASEVEDS